MPGTPETPEAEPTPEGVVEIAVEHLHIVQEILEQNSTPPEPDTTPGAPEPDGSYGGEWNGCY